MNTITKILHIALLFLFCLLANLSVAQKKSETKLFKTVMAKGDTVSFNKFLSKYPNSVYTKIIRAKKDSLIKSYNTTIYSAEEACSIFKSAVQLPSSFAAGKDFIAHPQRKNNIESIIGVIAPSNGENSLRIVKCEQNGDNWNVVLDRTESRYIQDDNLELFNFVPSDRISTDNGSGTITSSFAEVEIANEKYLLFNYINYTTGFDERSRWENNSVELIANLLSLSGENLFNTMYYGERIGDNIFGNCSDSAQSGVMATPQINYLVRHLAGIETLKPADKERELTKEAIRWWYKNNPAGKTTLNFGVLEKDHPIIQKFLQSKTIERSANNSADFFDIMGTTVLCAYNNSTNQYLLVWCEPQPQDPKKDKDLGNIYFEKGNTIVLYYYEGNKTYKERINLGTRQKRQ